MPSAIASRGSCLLMLMCLSSALQFFFYDVYKEWMFGDAPLSPWQRLLAGGNAGATACVLTCKWSDRRESRTRMNRGT